MDLKRLIIDLQDVQQKIENSGLTDESEELQNIIDEIIIISNRPKPMPKIAEMKVFEGKTNLAVYLNKQKIYGLDIIEDDKEIFFGEIYSEKILEALKKD